MDITLLLPAILVALFTYLGAPQSPWLIGKTGGFYLLGRPLVAGLLVGIVFGDLQVAITCAITVQVLYLANSNSGGKSDSDITCAAYAGIALAVATNRQPWTAVIVAYLIGKLFQAVFSNRILKLNAGFNKQVETTIKEGEIANIARFHVWQPQALAFLLRFIPMFILIFFGAPLLNWFFRVSPLVILDSLSAIGWILPVIGLVTMMSHLVKFDWHLLFVLAGLLAAGAFGVPIAWLFVIGLVVMVAYLIIDPKKIDKSTKTVAKDVVTNEEGVV